MKIPIRKIWDNRFLLRSIIHTIYFNFHYLPFKQACKLPVFLYKPKFVKCKGTISIESDNIRFGMIRLGFMHVPIFPNSGIIWENHGGKTVFQGRCNIGNASAISTGKTGNIVFGNNFFASCGLKIVSCHQIRFAENMVIGWDSIVIDTPFHKVKDMNNRQVGKGYGSVIFGKNNWLGNRCIVLPGTKSPDYCIFGAGSVSNKDYSSNPTHILMAGNPLTVKRTGVWRDTGVDDSLEYENLHDNQTIE
ncbi:MAG: hypothetical protein FWF53_02195 [Candidatus Azobacteroides sp.]|nr:hypothetical protein [Candidatus Azobacteroides sp.]